MSDSRNTALLALGAALVVGGAGFWLVARSETVTAPAATVAEAPVPSAAPSPDEAGAWAAAAAAAEPRTDIPVMTVWKSPTCGCCGSWVEHLRANGFRVEVNDVQNLAAVKAEHGIPGHLASCHTAEIGDYLVEGHVPADDILRLLDEAPDVAGLAVPGMPVGSPGMEMGDRRDPYETLAFGEDGGTTVWAEHNR